MIRDLLDDIDNYSSEPDRFLDVPFVPSDEAVVEAMLALAKVGPEDVVYDLGSGDGRILIAAARHRDARGVGVELDPDCVAEARDYAAHVGVEGFVGFIEGDIFTADISNATVVTLYLLQAVNMRLRPRLLNELRPGTRVVSHAFDMGDWQPDDWLKLSGANLYMWIVPARVAGAWEWEGPDGTPYRVELRQKHQEVRGRAWRNGKRVQLESADLKGSRLDLTLGKARSRTLETFTLTFADGELQSARGPTAIAPEP